MMTAPNPSNPTLRSLLSGIAEIDASHDRAIAGLSLDSRAARAGDCFFAVRGVARHGREFLEAALARGVAAILVEDEEPGVTLRAAVPILALPNLRAEVGRIASRFYGEPSRALQVLGVTGTNGKTSVTHLLAQALNALHGEAACGLLGTVGHGFPGELEPSAATTPDPISLQQWLARLRERGARAVAIEVSSHGLDQDRAAGTRFAAAVFTNLTRDHLDYHGDMAAYATAKRKLFQTPALGAGVVNLDDPFSAEILEGLSADVPAYGYTQQSARRAPGAVGAVLGERRRLSAEGIEMAVRTPAGSAVLSSRLLGGFNAANLLAALTALLALEVPLHEAVGALGSAHGVPGRMERFGGEAGAPLVIVDYAHTPDGLEQALRSCRDLARGQLWCVFGCGGNRDPGKRPLMGALAAQWADRVIVTSDNPRHEEPLRIIEAVLSGMTRREQVTVEAERERAIRETIAAARAGDLVLIAGKGHEAYQEIAGQRLPFSDRAVALAALRERSGEREA